MAEASQSEQKRDSQHATRDTQLRKGAWLRRSFTLSTISWPFNHFCETA